MTVNMSLEAATERAMTAVIKAGEVYWFGCPSGFRGHGMTKVGASGDPDGFERRNPWGSKIDGGLCPGAGRPAPARGGMESHLVAQVEGEGLWHFKDGWSAIAFWDRSVDSRGNSNSVFIVRGSWSFKEVVEIAKRAFPDVWARFDFKVIHVTRAPKASSPAEGGKP